MDVIEVRKAVKEACSAQLHNIDANQLVVYPNCLSAINDGSLNRDPATESGDSTRNRIGATFEVVSTSIVVAVGESLDPFTSIGDLGSIKASLQVVAPPPPSSESQPWPPIQVRP